MTGPPGKVYISPSSGKPLPGPVKIILAFMAVLLLVGAGFYITNLLEKNKRAGLPWKNNDSDKLLATVAGQKIYLSAAQEITGGNPNREGIQSALEILTERAVLDYEADKLGIKVTEDELKKKLGSMNPATQSAGLSPFFAAQVKYQMLKDKVFSKQVMSATAYILSFWVPPYDWPEPLTEQELQTIRTQRGEGTKALKEAEELVRQGADPLQVTQQLYDKYLVLRPILALNGYIFEKNKNDLSVFTVPQAITYNPNDNSPVYEALFLMKEGEVKVFEAPRGMGGALIQVISKNPGKRQDYAGWLKEKKGQLVKLENI